MVGSSSEGDPLACTCVSHEMDLQPEDDHAPRRCGAHALLAACILRAPPCGVLLDTHPGIQLH